MLCYTFGAMCVCVNVFPLKLREICKNELSLNHLNLSSMFRFVELCTLCCVFVLDRS